MQPFNIKNGHGFEIVGYVNLIEPIKNIAFIAHGLGGFKEQRHIQVFAKAFEESGISTILWDFTNSIGKSGGKMEDASITSYLGDLEEVLNLSKEQSWYREPFILCGHSLGGITTAIYAEKHPKKVKGLAPISTVVSGKLSWDSYTKKELDDWRKKGSRFELSKSKPWVIKKLKWSHMEDRLKYDILKNVRQLTMPVLLIVGSKDKSTPEDTQKLLYEALPTKHKELHIIKNAPHSFYNPFHLSEVKKIIINWINSNGLNN